MRTARASLRRPRDTIAAHRRHGRTAIYGQTVTGAGSEAAIYGCRAAGSHGAPGVDGCPATGAARDRCGSTSTARGDRQARGTPHSADGSPGTRRRDEPAPFSLDIMMPAGAPARPAPPRPDACAQASIGSGTLGHRYARRSAVRHPGSASPCRTSHAPCSERPPLQSPRRVLHKRGTASAFPHSGRTEHIETSAMPARPVEIIRITKSHAAMHMQSRHASSHRTRSAAHRPSTKQRVRPAQRPPPSSSRARRRAAQIAR